MGGFSGKQPEIVWKRNQGDPWKNQDHKIGKTELCETAFCFKMGASFMIYTEIVCNGVSTIVLECVTLNCGKDPYLGLSFINTT